MKFPNHITLDVNKPTFKNLEQYWIFLYTSQPSQSFFFNESVRTFQRFKNKRVSLISSRLKNEEKFTFVHNLTNKIFLSSSDIKEYYLRLFKSRPKVTNKLFFSKHVGKKAYKSLKKIKTFNLEPIQLFITKKFSRFQSFKVTNVLFWKIFDIHFFKKEHLYTKLKYSRTPQYDMVSGGAAALFAGFLGFLICEKFGLELLDSGDFYFLFMYFVFFFFF